MSEHVPTVERANGAYVFRLYLADGAPNSVRALANLYAICRQHFPECHRIEVIDVLKEPLRALAEGVFVGSQFLIERGIELPLGLLL